LVFANHIENETDAGIAAPGGILTNPNHQENLLRKLAWNSSHLLLHGMENEGRFVHYVNYYE
jgi:hypothetical protein